MPWSPSDATSHTKKAKTPHQKRTFAAVANSVLKSTGDEGYAVRAGNAAVNKLAHKQHNPIEHVAHKHNNDDCAFQ